MSFTSLFDVNLEFSFQFLVVSLLKLFYATFLIAVFIPTDIFHELTSFILRI